MKELFDIPQQDSPRLAWLKKHEIHIAFAEIEDATYVCCGIGNKAGYGDSMDDVVLDWARKNRKKLWNEE